MPDESPPDQSSHIPVRIMAPRHLAPMLTALMELLTSDRCATAAIDRQMVVQVTQLDPQGGEPTLSFFSYYGVASDPVTHLRQMMQLMAQHREATDLETSRQVAMVAQQGSDAWAEWCDDLYQLACRLLSMRNQNAGVPPHGLPPNRMGVLWELRDRVLDLRHPHGGPTPPAEGLQL